MPIIRSTFLLFLALGASTLLAQENCFNALDDDGDGLFDLNDTTDCVCINGLNIGGDVSLIPNPSFEDTDCLPQSWSELSCASGWEQATQPTSDYFNTQSYYPPIFPQPVPDGAGLAGGYMFPGWQEYLGACLTGPMLAGEQYSMTFDVAAINTDGVFSVAEPPLFGPVDITIFGLSGCVPFPVNTFDCPVGMGWTELGSVNYTPSNTWSTVTITFTPPFDVATIILGSPCVLPPDYVTDGNGNNPYFFYDDLQLGEDVAYNGTIEQVVDAVIDPLDGSCTVVHELYAHPDTLTGIYQWYQEGVALLGQTDTILDLAANGLDEGLYQFYYQVDDTTCVITEFLAELPVYPGPELTMDDPDGCEPHAVSFTNSTPSTEPMLCEWAFGNGGSSLICDPSMTFVPPGVYDVTLTITYDDVCPMDTTYVNAVEVFEIPVASFTTDTLIGCIDLPVQFTNTSTGPVASGVYDFGDSFSANTLDANHTYTTAGFWDVQFTITSPGGCIDDTTMVALITSVDSPTVLFTADTTYGCSPVMVQFSNNTDPNYVGSCDWVFGDSGTSTDCDPAYAFATPGIYTVTLNVTTPWGCAGSLTVPDMITVYGHPEPTFTLEPDSGCYPLEVVFTNTTTDIITPDGCAWTFGDGSIGAPCDPTYSYAEPGIYDVSLTVTSPEGCLGDTTYSNVVTVFDHPTSDFTFGPQPTDLFEPEIVFANSSSQDVILWDWAFGTGGILGTSTLTNPELSFPGEDGGEYPVTLIVTNTNGCMDTTTLVVVINGHFSVYVPNTFTPDEDGVNDVFLPVVKDQDPSNHLFAVYDRWGERIFETSDASDPWDGTVGGSEAKQDVYVWQVESTSLIDGQRRMFLGHVTLIR